MEGLRNRFRDQDWSLKIQQEVGSCSVEGELIEAEPDLVSSLAFSFLLPYPRAKTPSKLDPNYPQHCVFLLLSCLFRVSRMEDLDLGVGFT